MRAIRCLTALAAVGAVIVGAAGYSGAAAGRQSAAAAAVPADVREAGVLVVASEIAYPPFEFYDDQKRPQGVDYDLAVALADRMDLRLEFRNVPWDDIIPTVAEHRADAVMSGMTDNAERQQKLTYVDYLVEGSQVVVVRGNPAGIGGLDAVCGRRVALQADTTQSDLVGSQAKLCTAAGRPAPKVLAVSSGDTYPLLKNGTADAVVDGYTSAATQVKEGAGAFEFAGVQVEASPMGIGLARDRVQLRHAVQLALRELIADGTYAELLDKWGLRAEALTTAAIDGGV
ncbi:ABC transporter substrate-binding protein [Actinoplanes sp. NPDC049316]|uniref:ABC transporter substrate-binding protein n=1 Tax=Actinoplanes sp. NPDC049316 TaxID=3154727 RepID=UPI00342479B9